MDRWIPVSVALPPQLESGMQRSCNVLVTDGKSIWHAYYNEWPDEPTWNDWIIVGRDGYRVEAKITHWQVLPELPK